MKRYYYLIMFVLTAFLSIPIAYATIGVDCTSTGEAGVATNKVYIVKTCVLSETDLTIKDFKISLDYSFEKSDDFTVSFLPPAEPVTANHSVNTSNSDTYNLTFESRTGVNIAQVTLKYLTSDPIPEDTLLTIKSGSNANSYYKLLERNLDYLVLHYSNFIMNEAYKTERIEGKYPLNNTNMVISPESKDLFVQYEIKKSSNANPYRLMALGGTISREYPIKDVTIKSTSCNDEDLNVVMLNKNSGIFEVDLNNTSSLCTSSFVLNIDYDLSNANLHVGDKIKTSISNVAYVSSSDVDKEYHVSEVFNVVSVKEDELVRGDWNGNNEFDLTDFVRYCLYFAHFDDFTTQYEGFGLNKKALMDLNLDNVFDERDFIYAQYKTALVPVPNNY